MASTAVNLATTHTTHVLGTRIEYEGTMSPPPTATHPGGCPSIPTLPQLGQHRSGCRGMMITMIINYITMQHYNYVCSAAAAPG